MSAGRDILSGLAVIASMASIATAMVYWSTGRGPAPAAAPEPPPLPAATVVSRHPAEWAEYGDRVSEVRLSSGRVCVIWMASSKGGLWCEESRK